MERRRSIHSTHGQPITLRRGLGAEHPTPYPEETRKVPVTTAKQGKGARPIFHLLVEYDYDEEGAVRWKSDSGVLSLYNGFDPEDSSAYRPDPYNRIKRERTVVDGKTLGVSYSYDLMDRITGVGYPNTRKVDYSYNTLGELAGVSGYLLEAPLYNKGLLEKLVAANGVESVFSYDENGRAKSIQSAKDGASVNSYSFTYDNADNIIRRNDDAFEYDGENRLKGSYLKGSFPADVKEGSQSVGAVREDLFGRKQLEFSLEEVLEDINILELDYAAGSIGVDLKGEYAVSRIELVPQAGANRVIPEAVRVFTSSSNFPNEYTEVSGFTASYVEVDGVSVLRILLNSAVNARYIKVKTDFDDREKIQFLPVNKAGFKNAPDKIIRVYYKVATRNELFEQDEVSNRTRQQVTLAGTRDRGYKYYPGCNRLMTDGKYAYQYDRNGNVVKKGSVILIGGTATKVEEAPASYWASLTGTEASITGLAFSAVGGVYWEYEYDLSNRLTGVRRNGIERASYAYNESGLMVKKTVGSVSTYYSWSPNGKMLYAETGTACVQYVWVNGKLFAYEKGAADGSGTATRMYTHVDQVGSVTAITDNAGAPSWKNEFTPYGELADGDRAAPDGVQMYAGHFWEEEAGLYYSNARWYDPTTGRFVSEDPARDGQNWYVYCKANPMGYVDPLGLITAVVMANEPAVVCVYSGITNSSGAMTGLAYVFSSDQTSTRGAIAVVDTDDAIAAVPVVSGGANNANPCPEGTYYSVQFTPCADSRNSADTLTDPDYGGEESQYALLGIEQGEAAGNAVHQGRNSQDIGKAETAGCIGITSFPGEQNATANLAQIQGVTGDGNFTVTVTTQPAVSAESCAWGGGHY